MGDYFFPCAPFSKEVFRRFKSGQEGLWVLTLEMFRYFCIYGVFYYTPDKRSLKGVYWSHPVVGRAVTRSVGRSVGRSVRCNFPCPEHNSKSL